MKALVRSAPDQVGHYREALRRDFWFSCGYCNLAESEACGKGFQVDHYQPVERMPELDREYTNLHWSCQPCNVKKSDLPEDPERLQGYRFFCADHDDPEEHFGPGANVERIVSKTEKVGRYSLEVLDLNRRLLREVRKLRQRLYASEQTITLGLRSLQSVKLDSLPRETRLRFLEIRRDLSAASRAALEDETELLVKTLAHSALLDPDPEAKEHTAARREFLQQIRARVPST
ncbi:MAG: HNH endonuclease [Myxococcales bacterium]|nr:HNH endonuclease [Myxococcales bacterium]